jgi:hypothetical protein
MMEALTLDRAKALAAEVVAEFGENYKYPEDHRQWHAGTRMCVYVHEDKPSCFVGQILHRHGVSLAALSLHEFKGAYRVTADLVPGTDVGALRYLNRLQDHQDEDNTWGSALAYANI